MTETREKQWHDWVMIVRFVWLYYGNNSGDCEEMKLYITLRL